MKVIQVRMDERILKELDEAAACDGKARAVLVRQAVARMLRKRRFAEMDRRTIQSLKEHPQDLEEVEEWTEVQDWGDERITGKFGDADSAPRITTDRR
jgi:metal-responsive CopG/Arc/MetJ family transcriptional regulator